MKLLTSILSSLLLSSGIALDPCANLECGENGSCILDADRAVCDCDDGFTNKENVCVKDDPCDNLDCGDNGSCILDADQAVCDCDDGFTNKDNVCEKDDPCDNLDCGDNESCIVDEGTATCKCNNGFVQGDNGCIEDPEPETQSDDTECDIGVDMTDLIVSCTPGGIAVTVDECAFKNIGVEAADIKLSEAGDECNAIVAEGDVKFMIPASSACGTKVEATADKLIFSNTIHGVTGMEHGSISRARAVTVDFSCGLALDQMVSLEKAISPLVSKVEIDIDSQDSQYTVSMAVFTDDTFATKAGEDYSVSVPEPIFFGVALPENDVGHMKLETTKCWATPSSDAADEENYVFVDKSCNIEDDFLTMTNKGSSVEFALQSFHFKDSDKVFIHCNVHLCDPNLETCEVNCNSGRRRRSADANAAIKIGPIVVKQ